MKRMLEDLILRLKKSNLRVYEDMLACVFVSLASAFYFFDTYNTFSRYISWFLTVASVLCWIICAIRNGFLQRVSFFAFSVAYWIIPQIFIILYNFNDNVHNYSSLLRAAQRFSELLVGQPIERLAKLMNLSTITFGVIILLLVSTFFLLAYTLSSYLHKGNNKNDNTPH